jgi:hypothetical protein
VPKTTARATALAAMLLTAAPVGLRAEIVDRVMAVVNGAIVTQSDVYGAMAFGLVDAAGGADPLGSALEQLIERELVLAEVNRYAPPEPDEGAVAARAATMRNRFPTPEAYERALASNGYTDERVRAGARDAIRVEAYLNQRFDASLQPAERAAVIAQWKAGLRRRAEDSVHYHAPM